MVFNAHAFRAPSACHSIGRNLSSCTNRLQFAVPRQQQQQHSTGVGAHSQHADAAATEQPRSRRRPKQSRKDDRLQRELTVGAGQQLDHQQQQPGGEPQQQHESLQLSDAQQQQQEQQPMLEGALVQRLQQSADRSAVEGQQQKASLEHDQLQGQWQQAQGQQVQQVQQQQQQGAKLPPEEVWSAELRHLQGLMVNPHKPLHYQFVLQHCYTLNSADTQAKFKQLSAQAMGKVLGDRHRLEASIARAINALSTAWRRLQLLQEAVLDQGAALTDAQLAKEREQIVGIRDRLKQAQRLHSRTVRQATELGDRTYLSRAKALSKLLAAGSATAESYLSPGMSNIAAASKVNTMFRNAWAKTPQAQRPSPAVAEAQRQAQLSPLLPLLPEGPQALLGAYKQAAMAFQLHKDTALLQRTPTSGLPSSTGGAFWQATPPYSQQDTAAADGSGGITAQEQGTSTVTDNVAADQPQQQQKQQKQQQLVPPLKTGQPAWQQPPQQLLARPVQQLPLLPHLAKPWVKQQTLRFRQQRQEQEQEKQRQDQLRQLEDVWTAMPPSPAADKPSQTSVTSGRSEGASWGAPGKPSRGPLSLSGKVLPPLPVLLQRALEIEEQLLKGRSNE